MRSVGTRTTQQNSLPRAPPPPPSTSTHRGRGLEDRSYSIERSSQQPPPLTHAKGTTADERSFATVEHSSSYYGSERPLPLCERAERERPPAHNNGSRQVSNGNRGVSNGNRAAVGNSERQVSNAVFLNGGGRCDGRDQRDGGREVPRGAVSLDVCGNNEVSLNNDRNSSQQLAQYKEVGASAAKLDNHNNPPNILPISGKLEKVQSNDGLVRPSAFKPVVPKSFHSMQNLVCPPQTGRGGRSPGGGAGGGAGGGGGPSLPGPLRETDSSGSRGGGTRGGGGGGSRGGGQGSLSDSGRNSLTSLPTYAGSSSGYGPPPVLGPLSASTSHINRLGTTGALEKMDKPGGVSGNSGYQNGLSTSDSGRSSSGKSSSSYQRLSHLSDAPPPLRPSPSSDDVIQDLEDRLWEREQEVLHMRRNLDQSEAAIVQVFEEKQRVWERQMDDLRQNYASRLQQVTRRAQRSQSALQAQITRLSQDKRRLHEEMAALLAQREELERKCLDYRKEQADILPRLEETKWEVCQKAGEISLLKQQLRESQAEVTQRAGEMVALRGQLKEANAQLRDWEEAMLGLKDSYSTKSLELERCEGELQKTLTEVSQLRDKLGMFEAEVVGLKRALGELSVRDRAVEASGGGSREASRTRVGLPSPHSPPEGSAFSYPALPPPPVPPPDAILSLQSDEVQCQDAHHRQEAHMRQEAHQRQEAHLRQEAHQRQEAQLRQEIHQQRQEAHQQWEEAGDLRRQLEHLQGELRLERQQRERQALTFKKERHVWMDEKEHVLKYQAQLQLSYVETLQKNQALELRVGQLGSKLTSTNTTPSPTSPPPLSPIPLPAPVTPLPSLSLSPPPLAEDKKLPPALHQLAPPWPVLTRLERIESTEI
ncbi:leucine zipper putative tumor suppressor 3-like [Oncorhynchus kisutch]|uniref:Leucine zipper tumor suppressor family member 3 n=1 Tax=Oncorhynchus kisutch TaxID=8019 RepID=A0A8C7MUD1_ONCKI|nr:leucine zipper putative tumor suppressor 3-like [Oncorhynchus kisutch]